MSERAEKLVNEFPSFRSLYDRVAGGNPETMVDVIAEAAKSEKVKPKKIAKDLVLVLTSRNPVEKL